MTEWLEGQLVDGRYRVLKRLGQGGMGIVYLARVEGRAGFEKLVALKVVHPHVAHEGPVIEMFLSEARLSAQLNHANTAQIYDLGEADDLYYLAMEYVRGRDLRALMLAVDEREGRIPLPLCAFIVSKLCEGLEYAHELRDSAGQPMRLVHRDVTPVNCLLSYSGEVKLIDFGIAKAVNVASRTRSGMIRGKLPYMSPEQVLGMPLDSRSDIFALGVILYELLIGARPFDLEDDNELKVFERIRTGEHPRAIELDPELPPELDRIVERALAVKRGDRYQTAGALHEDLQRFLIAQQIYVSAKDLGAFLVEMVGVETARADGAAPAELSAKTSLKRDREGNSELRARVTTPSRPRPLPSEETRVAAQPTRRVQLEPGSLVTPPLEPEALSDAETLPPKRPVAQPTRREVETQPGGVPRAAAPAKERAGRPWLLLSAGALAVALAGAAVALLLRSEPDGPPLLAPLPPEPADSGVIAVLPSRVDPTPTEAKPEPSPQPPQPSPPEPPPEPTPKPEPLVASARKPPFKKVVAPEPDRPAPAEGGAEPPPREAEAFVTVRANLRSEVFIDGRSIGLTPRLRAPVKPGVIELRVDCLYPWGRRPGQTKRVELPAHADAEVFHECAERQP